MRGFFIPKRSGQHRQAGKALYRSLLSQCRTIPFHHEQQAALQNLVRNRFRANSYQYGQKSIKIAFRAGYTALELLDASTAGDASATSRISDYLSRVPYALTRPTQRAKAKTHEPRDRDPPLEKKFFSVFPRPTVAGIRKVPFMVDAQGIPFVRFKKPQPMNLTRVIRQTLTRHRKSRLLINNMQRFWTPLSEYEDDWDSLVSSHCGHKETDEVTYTEAAREHYWSIREGQQTDAQKSTDLAKKMLAIVDKEAELAEKEKIERRRRARERRQDQEAADSLDTSLNRNT